MLRKGEEGEWDEREEEKQKADDNEMYRKAVREEKQREKGNKKQIEQELLKAKVDDKQHVNLFKQEQINDLIRQKKLEQSGEVEGKEDYLKKTGHLGDLLKDRQRPWYVKTVQPEEAEIQQQNEDIRRMEQFMVKEQIKQFKT